MKYRQLTKEQLESLHKEFAQFLAAQEIDVNEWTKIKKENPELVEKELNLFSDMVWEDVLSKVAYLEHFSNTSVNLFKFEEKTMKRIVIKVQKEVDLHTEEGYKWLLQNPQDDSVEYFTGEKEYTDKNSEIFDLIEKGGQICKGELYEYFNRLVS